MPVAVIALKIPHLCCLGLLEHMKLGHLQILVIITKAFGMSATAVDALQKNVFDVIAKSFKQVELNHMIHTSRPDDDIGSHGTAAKMIKRCLHWQ